MGESNIIVITISIAKYLLENDILFEIKNFNERRKVGDKKFIYIYSNGILVDEKFVQIRNDDFKTEKILIDVFNTIFDMKSSKYLIIIITETYVDKLESKKLNEAIEIVKRMKLVEDNSTFNINIAMNNTNDGIFSMAQEVVLEKCNPVKIKIRYGNKTSIFYLNETTRLFDLKNYIESTANESIHFVLNGQILGLNNTTKSLSNQTLDILIN